MRVTATLWSICGISSGATSGRAARSSTAWRESASEMRRGIRASEGRSAARSVCDDAGRAGAVLTSLLSVLISFLLRLFLCTALHISLYGCALRHISLYGCAHFLVCSCSFLCMVVLLISLYGCVYFFAWLCLFLCFAISMVAMVAAPPDDADLYLFESLSES